MEAKQTCLKESTVERIKKFKQDHLLEVIPLIKDQNLKEEFITNLETIDFELLTQVSIYIYKFIFFFF